MTSTNELIDKLLTNRGIIDDNERRIFLNPDFKNGVYDPYLLQDMAVAVERILKAIESSEKIVIYGDYDCDGIPGSVVLHDFFAEIGYENFTNYIPHRHNEGYGLHNNAIEKFAKDGITLLISVDLGITNIKEVDFANSLGVDCIITDHHLPHEEIVDGLSTQIIPNALAVINAKRTGNQYPDNMLCGAATAWKLVCALVESGKKNNISGIEKVGDGFTKWLLDVVGIATIADMVPLTNENRVLAHYGLIVLRKSKRKGLQAMLTKAKMRLADLTEEDVAFTIAPRINAASRMDTPIEAFKLLSAKSEELAIGQANLLESLNTDRKENVAVFMKKAHNLARARLDMAVLVVGDNEWSPGVLGLIAGKLADEYNKTVFVWGKGESDSEMKGSCRSDGYTHLVDLMSAAIPGTFSAMGGHELAGGFTVFYEAIFDLEKNINDAYEKTKHLQLEKKSEMVVDTKLELVDVTLSTYNEIQKLAPFGIDNQKPLFRFEDVNLISARAFGKTKNHLEIIVGDDTKQIKAIQFFAGLSVKNNLGHDVEITSASNISLEAFIEKSTFAGKREIRLRIHKILI